MTYQTNIDTYRNVFSIINPETKKKYEDIVTSFIHVRTLNDVDLYLSKIIEPEDRRKSFILLVDQNTEDRIKSKGIAKTIISFQIRTKSDFSQVYVAVARLHKDEIK